ncbi:hypothetical protein D6D06_08268 [Aureobasidium pullulans]|nr:hypothetical protein D6D06_08268 [Aureobasidium pullulans]
MEGLMACLNQLQYLQIVEFEGEISTHDNSSDHRGELYPWLLQNSNLKEISLGTVYPMLLDHLTQVLQENDREVLAHRPNLNALGVHGPRQTILPLLSIATETLKRLDPAGNGPGDLPHDICNSLMQFPDLVELRLTLNDGYSMSTAEMGSISSLTRLKVLQMRSGRNGNNCMNLNWFTDDLFEIWICNLPNICELSLEWKTGLKTPLFPTLKRLELGEISPLIGSIPSSPNVHTGAHYLKYLMELASSLEAYDMMGSNFVPSGDAVWLCEAFENAAGGYYSDGEAKLSKELVQAYLDSLEAST